MNGLPSTEFRKTFARLREPVVVTVNGHPIGTWTPVRDKDLHVTVGESTLEVKFANVRDAAHQAGAEAARAIRDFRPAPKPSQKGK